MTPVNGQNIGNPIFGSTQIVTLDLEEIKRDERVTVQFVMECLMQGVLLSGDYYIVGTKEEVMKKLIASRTGK